MHPELKALLDLAECDLRISKLQRAVQAAQDRLSKAESELAQARDRLAQDEQAHKSEKESLRAFNRDISAFERRRNTATRALETGAGDPAAAQRQIDRCTEKLDELETNALGAMETIDELEGTIESDKQQVASATKSLDATRKATNKELKQLNDKLDAEQSLRTTYVAAVSVEHRSRYDLLKQRKGSAVASIRSDGCRACHIIVQAQMLSEIRMGKFLHTCRGCGRWLVILEE